MSIGLYTGFNAATLQRRYVDKVQHASTAIALGGSSATATIVGTGTTRTSQHHGGQYTLANSGTTNLQNSLCRVSLTAPRTVQTSRAGAAQVVTTTPSDLIEWGQDYAKVQTGTITIAASGTSNTATISSVDTTRAVVFFLGNTYGAGNWNNGLCNCELTNGTTVTVTRYTASATATTCGFCVVEFPAAMIQSVQHKSFTTTANVTSETDTFTSVTTGNTILLYNGWTTADSNASGAARIYHSAELTNGTTVTFTRGAASTGSRTHKYIILEFVAGVISSKQTGTIAVNSATTNTATVTGVDLQRTALFYNGFYTGYTGTDFDLINQAVILTNTTTLTAQRGAAGSATNTSAYQLVTFN